MVAIILFMPQMETQFDNLKEDEIDPNKEYYCSNTTKSTGFNLPMK